MTATRSVPRPAFAHASEAELARILDFYQVRWEYEPHTFPIGWSLTGEVVESFSPDFYLPDMELYVELTTLKQKLVRKKNRKLRRLRELYPDVRIKLFYARDFRMLLLKFGRHALVGELTGTVGQATPPRAASEHALDAGVRAGVVGPEPASPGRAAAAAASPVGPVRIPGAGLGVDEHLDASVAGASDLVDVVAGAVGPGLPAGRGRARRRGRRRRRSASAASLTSPANPTPGTLTVLAPDDGA